MSTNKSNTESTVADTEFELVKTILQGREQVVSHPGTSQYGTGAGLAACGLAALNCARIALIREQEGVRDEALLRDIISLETAEEITSICALWSSNLHLEIDDIYGVPIFESVLKLISNKYDRPGAKQFKTLLLELQAIPTSAAAIITRPPEIVACLKLVISDLPVFIIFDSHPRPDYPSGAGFVFNTSLDATARRLEKLLAVDSKLLADSAMQWQTQLLAHYSGHIFVSKSADKNHADLIQDVLHSSLATLTLQAEISDLKFQNSSLIAENQRLYAENDKLENKCQKQEAQLLQAAALHTLGSDGKKNKSPFTRLSNAVSGSSRRGHGALSYPTAPDRHRDATAAQRKRQSMDTHDKPPEFSSVPHQGSDEISEIYRLQRQFNEEDERLQEEQKALAALVHRNFDYAAQRKRQSMDTHEKPPEFSSVPHQMPLGSDGISETYRLQQQFNEEDARLRVEQKALAAQPKRQSMDTHEKPPELSSAPHQMPLGSDGIFETYRLQQQFNEEDALLRAQQKALEALVQRTFNCGICLEENAEDSVARVDGCGHQFCRECIREYIGSKLGDHRFPILCPVCTTQAGDDKPSQISNAFAQLVGLSEKQFATWTELEMVGFSIVLHCRKCQGWAFVDRQELEASDILTCPLPGCNHLWCKACQQDIVVGGPKHSCDGSAELDHLMKNEGWKYCPGCKTPIQKVSGCNHMTCMSPGCNSHFCYICGELIVRSAMTSDVKVALTSHYRRCQMFEVPQ